jgi:hypothetical protein
MCGGSRAFDISVWNQLTLIRTHTIKLCHRPLKRHKEIHVNPDILEIEVEESNIPTVEEVGRVLEIDPSSLECKKIITSLTKIVESQSSIKLFQKLSSYEEVYSLKPRGQYRISQQSIRDLTDSFSRWALQDLRFRCQLPEQYHDSFLDKLLLGYAERSLQDHQLPMVRKVINGRCPTTHRLLGRTCERSCPCFSCLSPTCRLLPKRNYKE